MRSTLKGRSLIILEHYFTIYSLSLCSFGMPEKGNGRVVSSEGVIQ